MDDIDFAQQREQKDRDTLIALARRQHPLPSTGECHWCAATVTRTAHFCDADCRSDYERELAGRRRAGLHR